MSICIGDHLSDVLVTFRSKTILLTKIHLLQFTTTGNMSLDPIDILVLTMQKAYFFVQTSNSAQNDHLSRENIVLFLIFHNRFKLHVDSRGL